MSVSGMNTGHPQHKRFLGKQAIRQCTRRQEGDDFVIIDVDNDDLHDVIIVDVPNSLQKKLKEPPARKIINLDDDEDGTDEASGGSNVSGPSGECGSVPFHSPNSVHENGNGSSSAGERNTPVNLSKSKRTYSGKTSAKRHFGSDSESENGLPESDCSDCEMEGSSSKLREEWEKAFLKRSCDSRNVRKSRSDLNHQTDTSDLFSGFDSNCGENIEMEDSEVSDSFSSHLNNGEENLRSDEIDGSCSSFNDHVNDPPIGSTGTFPDQGQCSEKGTYARCRYGQFNSFTFECAEMPPYVHVESGGSSCRACKENVEGPSMCSAERSNTADTFQEMESNFLNEPCSYNRQPSFDEQFDCEMTDAFVTSPNLATWSTADADGDYERIPSVIIDYESTEPEPCCTPSDGHPNLSEWDDFTSGNTSAHNSDLCDKGEHRVKNTACCEEPIVSSLWNHLASESKNKSQTVADGHGGASSDDLCNRNGIAIGLSTELSPSDIITDRQKIKETDEYKRAMEAEWASRNNQLRIQAEEAQRLRRRKKAEMLRTLDMERRQRQRLEEVRQTQKKDEENLNLKEKLRVQIRNELNQIESRCSDMGSLLRRLGVHVDGGFIPSKNEVQKAYKSALLKFHPDRASRTDMRQQVEAEEKFKLISRMKEKLSFAR